MKTKTQAEIIAKKEYPTTHCYTQEHTNDCLAMRNEFVNGWNSNGGSSLKWIKINPNDLPPGLILMKNSTDSIIIGIVLLHDGKLYGYYEYPIIESDYEYWELLEPEYYIDTVDLINLKNH